MRASSQTPTVNKVVIKTGKKPQVPDSKNPNQWFNSFDQWDVPAEDTVYILKNPLVHKACFVLLPNPNPQTKQQEPVVFSSIEDQSNPFLEKKDGTYTRMPATRGRGSDVTT